MRIELMELNHKRLSARPPILYVTHDQIEAMTMADKIVVLMPSAKFPSGRLAARTLPQARAIFVAGFIG
ncbi:MAG: hypothetical protein NVV59_11235 [Chitinophagaceae bacterium]|nr:hypothetical protein [Chitinophagaceae bacterium]